MNKDNNIPMKKVKVFSRKENDGVTLLYSDFIGVQFLNATGSSIYELIDGIRTIDEICLLFSEKYTEFDKRQIYLDTQNFIYSLRNKGLLTIKEVLKDMDEGFVVIGEKYYRETSNFISKYFGKANTNIIGFVTVSDKRYYSTVAIRTRSFQLNEVYFAYIVDNEISSVVSIVGLDNTTDIVTISLILGTDVDSMKKLYFEVYEYLKKHDILKIKVVLSSDKQIENIVDFVESLGFEQEAILKKEMYGNDAIILTNYINL